MVDYVGVYIHINSLGLQFVRYRHFSAYDKLQFLTMQYVMKPDYTAAAAVVVPPIP